MIDWFESITDSLLERHNIIKSDDTILVDFEENLGSFTFYKKSNLKIYFCFIFK